jgi:hypothetical protein
LVLAGAVWLVEALRRRLQREGRAAVGGDLSLANDTALMIQNTDHLRSNETEELQCRIQVE